MKLRCRDTECVSHEDGQHLFTANITIDEDREVAENLRKIEAGDFTCCFCGDAAEDESLHIRCLSCSESGYAREAVALDPCSSDMGRTLIFHPTCAACHEIWWDGSDWDGRHLSVSLVDEGAVSDA